MALIGMQISSSLKNVINNKIIVRSSFVIAYYFIAVLHLFSGISKILDPSQTIEILNTVFMHKEERNLIMLQYHLL